MIDLIATTTFGLEATVKREVTRLGFEITKTSNGRIDFTGSESAIAKSNIWLRSADRVLLKLGEFKATTFDELFEGTKALPWGEWITEDGKFTVIGKSIKSQLSSVPACQSIVKKAVVEKMKEKYKREVFEETGADYKIQVALLDDIATLTIDTTGPGLHKRGYRQIISPAPIKETLAAAMIELSFFFPERVFLDAVCGSGTIPIEAAMIARNIAPGGMRRFAAEKWGRLSDKMWKEVREEAKDMERKSLTPVIYASDIDENAIKVAQHNARLAGVKKYINFDVRPLNQVTLPADYGVCIMNPPYGERLGEEKEVEQLYRDMGEIFANNRKWSTYVITSNENFENLFGRRADAKRKLFNGVIKTDYYQFYGEKPPRE